MGEISLFTMTQFFWFLTLISIIITRCTASFSSLKEDALHNFDWQVETRRWLHQHPELAFKEVSTSIYIQEKLTKLDVPFTTGWGKRTLADGVVVGGTGIVGEIGSGNQPCVALRADIDALPIVERTPISYRSLNEGVMHACGHDAHTSILLGAIRILKKHEKELNGTVRFLFQPAEEGGGGGECMVNEGVLSKSPPVESIFGLHVNHALPTGIVGSKPGPLMASQQSFDIHLEGFGGHAAYPHNTKDPISVAALIIQGLNALISRGSSPTEHEHAAVVSVTTITTPESYNVIPPYADLKGSIRALNINKIAELKVNVKLIAENIASSFGLSATVVYDPVSYPPTINDPKLYEWTAKTLQPDFDIINVPPTMGAEDFSYYGIKIPANFLFFGIGSGKNPPTNITVHNPRFAVDENALPIASAMLSHLVIERLKTLEDASRVKVQEEL